MRGVSQALELELHRPRRGKADHFAQKIGIATPLEKTAKPAMRHRYAPPRDSLELPRRSLATVLGS